MRMVLATDVSSFDQTAFKITLAAQLTNVAPSDISLTVEPASIAVTASFGQPPAAPTASNLAALHTLAANATLASTILGVPVTSVDTPTTTTIMAAPPDPPTPPPPVVAIIPAPTPPPPPPSPPPPSPPLPSPPPLSPPASPGGSLVGPTIAAQSGSSSDDDNTLAVVGIVMGVVGVIALVATYLLFSHFRKKRTSTTVKAVAVEHESVGATSSTITAGVELKEEGGDESKI